MYGLLTKCEVKMVGYWPSSFFACLWTETKSRSINSKKRTRPILFFPVDRDTHEIFYRLQSNVFDAASLFNKYSIFEFKPITWCIEMHHVRTFFSVWRHGLFVLRDVHSQRVYLQEESLPCFLSAIELSAWPLFNS